jgi:hypothetical protein|tara:strand:- start:3027 stop:3317 length:291 start_codon:yes stop_codon:yes gene_type:complete
MNRRMAANPNYGYGSHFGAVQAPTINAGSAIALVAVAGVVGAVASGMFVGTDPGKNARFRALLSPKGSMSTGLVAGLGLGAIVAGALFVNQQGGFS